MTVAPRFKTRPRTTSRKGQDTPAAPEWWKRQDWTPVVSASLVINVRLSRRATALSFATGGRCGRTCTQNVRMTDDTAASGQIGPLPDPDSIAPDRGGRP